MKQERVLELFFRAIRGEDLSIKKLAGEYCVSTKSISRDINDLKAFLADHRELVGNTELQYSHQGKSYHLYKTTPEFDEGLLRQRSLFMWPGKLRTIRFEFSGPSVQAVLDKLPTAKIIERLGGNKYLIEAEVYGDGIKMWLLSQGSWVKVVAPNDFVEEMKKEIELMQI